MPDTTAVLRGLRAEYSRSVARRLFEQTICRCRMPINTAARTDRGRSPQNTIKYILCLFRFVLFINAIILFYTNKTLRTTSTLFI